MSRIKNAARFLLGRLRTTVSGGEAPAPNAGGRQPSRTRTFTINH